MARTMLNVWSTGPVHNLRSVNGHALPISTRLSVQLMNPLLIELEARVVLYSLPEAGPKEPVDDMSFGIAGQSSRSVELTVGRIVDANNTVNTDGTRFCQVLEPICESVLRVFEVQIVSQRRLYASVWAMRETVGEAGAAESDYPVELHRFVHAELSRSTRCGVGAAGK